MEFQEKRAAMLLQAMTASTEMYKENTRILALLDDKAQKTATLAGVFLAAAFAFLRKDALTDLITAVGGRGIGFLTVAIGLFLLCVFCGGMVIWARKLQLPPDPNAILRTCDILLSDFNEEVYENHIRDQTHSWNRALVVQDQIIMDKSQRLLASQCFLLGGIGMVVALLCLFIFAVKNP